MKYTVKVNKVRKNEGNLRGFATVVFGESFKITNIAILENSNGNLIHKIALPVQPVDKNQKHYGYHIEQNQAWDRIVHRPAPEPRHIINQHKQYLRPDRLSYQNPRQACPPDNRIPQCHSHISDSSDGDQGPPYFNLLIR